MTLGEFRKQTAAYDERIILFVLIPGEANADLHGGSKSKPDKVLKVQAIGSTNDGKFVLEV